MTKIACFSLDPYWILRKNLEDTYGEIARYIRARDSLETLAEIGKDCEKEAGCSILEAGDLQHGGYIDISRGETSGDKLVDIVVPEFYSFVRHVRVTEKGRGLIERIPEYRDILREVDYLGLVSKEMRKIKRELKKAKRERLGGYTKIILGAGVLTGSSGGVIYCLVTPEINSQILPIAGLGIGAILGISIMVGVGLIDGGRQDIKYADGELSKHLPKYQDTKEGYETKLTRLKDQIRNAKPNLIKDLL